MNSWGLIKSLQTNPNPNKIRAAPTLRKTQPAKTVASQNHTFGLQKHYFDSVFSPSGRGPKTCLFAGCLLQSGTKKEHKPKLLSPDVFRWDKGLPHEGVGAKKFGMSLETREIKLFWRDIPGFCWDIPALPEKFEKKKVCVSRVRKGGRRQGGPRHKLS